MEESASKTSSKEEKQTPKRPAPIDGQQVHQTIRVGDKLEYSAHLKKMDRNVLQAALALAYPGGDKPPLYVDAGEVILKSTWIGGDDIILANEELLVAASFKAFELIEIKEAELVKY